ncbi:MAG: hypothetical protein ACI9JM_002628 [Halioglobus sp.]|jgi:hypothetical protein
MGSDSQAGVGGCIDDLQGAKARRRRKWYLAGIGGVCMYSSPDSINYGDLTWRYPEQSNVSYGAYRIYVARLQ